MTVYALALAALVVTLTVSEIHRERERKRHTAEVEADRTEIALLHVAHREHTAKMFDAYREDVAQLCQRIQAPELAVVEHQQGRVMEPDSYPLTDEALAAEQEKANLLARMEQIENEGILS